MNRTGSKKDRSQQQLLEVDLLRPSRRIDVQSVKNAVDKRDARKRSCWSDVDGVTMMLLRVMLMAVPM